MPTDAHMLAGALVLLTANLVLTLLMLRAWGQMKKQRHTLEQALAETANLRSIAIAAQARYP